MTDAIDWESMLNTMEKSSALLVSAGAGMGVDSGLPDFRGDEGFWKAYPPFRRKGYQFVELANPRWFWEDPELAWGFYGHRLELYRQTSPHRGFDILLDIVKRYEGGGFVFTSNVDGQFQQAGFPDARVVECHGSLLHLQCSENCSQAIWSTKGLVVDVDMDTIRAVSELPRCPRCHAIARPAILMFGDAGWNASRTNAQSDRYQSWLTEWSGDQLVIIEIGAGTAVPTVRRHSERLVRELGATLIRINPRESVSPVPAYEVPMTAFDALTEIQERMNR